MLGRESRSTDAIALCGALLMAANMIWPTIPQYVGIPILIFLSFLLAIRLIWTDSRTDDESKEPASAALPDLRALDCQKIKGLLDDDSSRRRFVEQLRNGTLTTWAYCKDRPDHQKLGSSHWSNASLVYETVNGAPATNVLPNSEKRTRPWTSEPVAPKLEYWHDVWFNEDQLKKHWPDKF